MEKCKYCGKTLIEQNNYFELTSFNCEICGRYILSVSSFEWFGPNVVEKDINFSNGETSVLGKGKKYRYVKIHPNNLNLIKRWLDIRNGMKIKESFKEFLLVNEN